MKYPEKIIFKNEYNPYILDSIIDDVEPKGKFKYDKDGNFIPVKLPD